MDEEQQESKLPAPIGKCQCGCGQTTSIATKTRQKDGIIKGQYVRYLSGHHFRKSPVEYVVQEAGYITPCWLWQRALSVTGGYGQMVVDGKTRPSHRVYYERLHGALSPGYELDHLCRNRACVNPEHLEPVTRAENVRRGKLGKLTNEQVEAIRTDVVASNRDLAEKYGVTRDFIACIRPPRLRPAEEPTETHEALRAKYAPVLRPQLGYGLCQCGCGQKTPIAKRNEYRRGHIKGEPIPLIQRHFYRHKGPLYEAMNCGFHSPCWVWLRGKISEGYGEISLDRKLFLAHRMFYEDAHGPIPKGMHLDHLCRNRACVNPSHLQVVTPAENAQRNQMAKLTMEQAREIFAMEGNYRHIAKKYGISPQLVCGIKKGRNWKEIA